MSLTRIDAWLRAQCAAAVGQRWTVESGPGEWDEAYLRRVLQFAPAVVVAFQHGEAREREDLDLDTRWTLYVVGTWIGEDREASRTGPVTGAWPAAEACAAAVHHCQPPGGNIGIVHVSGIENLWSGMLDERGLSLVAVGLEVELAVDPDVAAGELDEFLRAGVEWDIDADGQPDIDGTFDIRQGDE